MKNFVLASLIVSLSACGPGPAGPQGAPGKDGTNGTNGKDGMGLTKKEHCYALSGGAFTHEIYTFADGSIMSTCEISSGDFTVSSVRMWKAGTNGSETGFCSLVDDWTGGTTSGWWKFERIGQYSTAVYSPAGTAGTGTRLLTCTTF